MNFAISRESIIISLFATETVYIYTCNGVSIINTENDFCLLFPHLSHLSLRIVLDSVAAVIRRNMTSTLAPECVEKKKSFSIFRRCFCVLRLRKSNHLNILEHRETHATTTICRELRVIGSNLFVLHLGHLQKIEENCVCQTCIDPRCGKRECPTLAYPSKQANDSNELIFKSN